MDHSRKRDQKREHYLREIARRTPPKHRHDHFMLDLYRVLLSSLGEPPPGPER